MTFVFTFFIIIRWRAIIECALVSCNVHPLIQFFNPISAYAEQLDFLLAKKMEHISKLRGKTLLLTFHTSSNFYPPPVGEGGF